MSIHACMHKLLIRFWSLALHREWAMTCGEEALLYTPRSTCTHCIYNLHIYLTAFRHWIILSCMYKIYYCSFKHGYLLKDVHMWIFSSIKRPCKWIPLRDSPSFPPASQSCKLVQYSSQKTAATVTLWFTSMYIACTPIADNADTNIFKHHNTDYI